MLSMTPCIIIIITHSLYIHNFGKYIDMLEQKLFYSYSNLQQLFIKLFTKHVSDINEVRVIKKNFDHY